jgi:purine-binding chemotaxis protein CheW
MTGQAQAAAGLGAPSNAAANLDWRTPGQSTGSGNLTQFISFAIGNDHYGVDIMSVREIKVWSHVTTIPKQPDFVRGVLNLRGVMVPIIDLRARFGQGLTDATPMHIVIIVQAGDRQVGLLADRVLDIVTFPESQIQAVPRVAQSSRIDFLAGLITTPSGLMALIDLRNLLSAAADDRAERSYSQ